MEQPNLPQTTNTSMLPSSTMAIVSLVSGILGYTFFPIIGWIVALITGYMARQETRAIPPRASGDGMATAGIILGWVGIGLLVLAVCCTIAWFVIVIGLGTWGASQQ